MLKGQSIVRIFSKLYLFLFGHPFDKYETNRMFDVAHSEQKLFD